MTQTVPTYEHATSAVAQPERRWPWRTCAVLAAVLLFLGNLEVWAYPNVADTAQFVDTTREVLEREDVRLALATRIVDSMLLEHPILHAAVGDTVIAIVTGLLGSPTFQSIFASVATQLQAALVHGEQVSVVIESRELQVVVLGMAQLLAPDEADQLVLEDGALRIELFNDQVIPSYASEITILRWAGIAAGLVGLFLLVLPYVVRRDLWSLRLAGLALVSVALATFLVVVTSQWFIDLQVEDRHVQTIVSAITEGFFGWLIAQTVVVLLIGIGLCVYGFSLWPWWRRLAMRPA